MFVGQIKREGETRGRDRGRDIRQRDFGNEKKKNSSPYLSYFSISYHSINFEKLFLLFFLFTPFTPFSRIATTRERKGVGWGGVLA